MVTVSLEDSLAHLASISPLLQSLYSHTHFILYHFYRIVLPPLRSLTSDNPDLLSVALLIVILWFSLLVVNQAVRMAYGIVATAVKMAVVVAVVAVVLFFVNSDQVAEDSIQYQQQQQQQQQQQANGQYTWPVARRIFDLFNFK